MTLTNEKYILAFNIQKKIDRGYNDEQVFKEHNQGHTGKCVKGVNKHNVGYDSCAYVKKAMAVYLAMR